MALIGTISGSIGAGNALTSNNAITGTLVIANTTLSFPQIASDAVLFVSGAIGGTSKAVFGGDVQASGSLIVDGDISVNGGDIISTAGTFNFVSTAGSIYIGGSTTTSSFTGEVAPGTRTQIASVSEKLTHTSSAGGTVNFNLLTSNIFCVTNPSTGNILANFINVPTTIDRVITPTIIMSQSATPRIVNGVQINGGSGSILWANNVVPTGNANKQDVFGFSLIRSGSIWTVLGQMSTYG